MINGLNGDGQDTVAVRSDFSRARFAFDYRQLSRDHIIRIVPVGARICPLRLKRDPTRNRAYPLHRHRWLFEAFD